MAFGLAMIADNNIVVVSDAPVQFDDPTEELVQNSPLAQGWRAIITATPIEAEKIATHLAKSFHATTEGDEATVFEAINRGLRTYKLQIIDEYFRSAWGLSYEDFRSSEHLFSKGTYEEEIEKARDMAFDAELIVVGFLQPKEASTRPAIFAADRDWKIEPDFNFRAVGAGWTGAFVSLLSRNFGPSKHSLDQAVYLAYEAKKIAEQTGEVAAQTALTVYSSDRSEKQLSAQGETQLAKLFSSFGPRPLTGDLKVVEYF